MALYDQLVDYPEYRPWIKQNYETWRNALTDPAEIALWDSDFDTAWSRMSDQARSSFFNQGVRLKFDQEAQAAGATSGNVRGTQTRHFKVKRKEPQRDAQGNPMRGQPLIEVEVEVWQEFDPVSGTWHEIPAPGATPHEILMGAAKAKMERAATEAALKDIEMMEGLRPTSEKIAAAQMKTQKEAAEAQLKDIKAIEKMREGKEELWETQQELEQQKTEALMGTLKRAETARKLEPVKQLLIDPVKEAFEGGMRGMKKSGFGKGALGMAQDAFVATGQPGHALRPAPQSRFTTPKAVRTPQRMPIITDVSGKMIPAGAALIKKSELARRAVIQPTVAGSLLEPSVSKSPAAQSLLPSRPMRIGLSNLKTSISTSGLTRGGPLPKLKVKKNLYNEQLRKIRGMLR